MLVEHDHLIYIYNDDIVTMALHSQSSPKIILNTLTMKWRLCHDPKNAPINFVLVFLKALI